MQKNTLFYCIATILLASGLFFFYRAYRELVFYTALIDQTNNSYRHFKNLEININNAAVLNADRQYATDPQAIANLFIADSQSVYQELSLLRTSVQDSLNIRVFHQLDSIIHQEINWILKSNVPDSIVHRQAPKHIASFQQINLLINHLITRTDFLIGHHKAKLDEIIKRVIVWMIIFIVLAAVLLLFTVVNLLNQRSKRKLKEKELEISNRLLKNAQHIGQIGNWSYNRTSTELNWSDEMYNIWEISDNQFRPDYEFFIDTVHQEDRETVAGQIAAAFEGQKELNIEHRIILPGGKVKWVQEKGRLVYNSDQLPPVLEATVQDINKRKEEEQHLKLLESVIINTHDAIIITEAESLDLDGPRIIYVNNAFTRMTGYSREEVMGRTPRILQGPKTDKQELKRIKEALGKWQPIEATLLNYKKDGTEFWTSLSLNPVANDRGVFTHWIAIAKDATMRQNKELQKLLFAETSRFFNESTELNIILHKILEQLVDVGNFSLAEAWLIGKDGKRINVVSRYMQDVLTQVFYDESDDLKSFAKGEGLPGAVWSTRSIQHWQNVTGAEEFIRKKAGIKAGFTSISGIPLFHQNEVIGVLLLAYKSGHTDNSGINNLFENYGHFLGAEIKRKQLELELNQVFSSAPDIICIAGIDGYIKRINQAGCELLGYTEEEILSVPYLNFIHPADRGKSVAVTKDVNAQAPSFYIEIRFISRTGKILWLAWTTTPSPEEGLIFGVAKDITEKKELEDRLNKINNMAGIGSWEADPVNRTLSWSETIYKIHEVGERFTPQYDDLIHFFKTGENKNTIARKIKDAIELGTSWDEELQIVTPGNNEKWVRMIGDAEFINGTCMRVYGSMQDINDRKKAEINAINILLEKNTILESIGDAFFAVDLHWIVTYWNRHAETILGVFRNEIVGKNLWEIFSNSIDSESYRKYHEAMETQQVIHFEDFYHPVGKWYEISAYPSVNGLSVYFKDITDRKEAEIHLQSLNEALQKHAKELAASNRELEQFAYVASHDLQEPLRMVTSFLTQLEKKYENIIDSKGKKYIDFAVDGARRMRQIILDLLEFSRVGRTDGNKEQFDLNELVKDMRLLFKQQIKEKGAIIHADKLPRVYADKTPMRQVFQNLIGNALKYSRPGVATDIRITAEDFPGYWQFAVSDNGIGIDEEYFEKIFVIFQRLHNKDEYSGTGIGLAITKKIIESQGGKIWLKSEEGKGTTFYFTILKQR